MEERLLGAKYYWDNVGWIKFKQDGILETCWGDGIYYRNAENIVYANWNGFSHFLRFSESYTCAESTRVIPEDYIVSKVILVSDVVMIYGNSHAYFQFNQLEKSYLNMWNYSVTMHRIGRDKIINGFDKTHLGEDRVFCFVYGEVDVRCHIGKQIILGRNLEDICNSLVSEYLQTIKDTITKYKKIIVIGITPTVDRKDFKYDSLPFVGTNDERIRYTKVMNDILRKSCENIGFLFSSPYEFCTRDDGCLDYSFTDNYIHIKKNAKFLEAISLLL